MIMAKILPLGNAACYNASLEVLSMRRRYNVNILSTSPGIDEG